MCVPAYTQVSYIQLHTYLIVCVYAKMYNCIVTCIAYIWVYLHAFAHLHVICIYLHIFGFECVLMIGLHFVILLQLDLPLSPLFYKWLLGQESTLCISDLQFLDHDLFSSISKLQSLLRDKRKIESDPSHVSPQRSSCSFHLT